jgi:hypothetical protein
MVPVAPRSIRLRLSGDRKPKGLMPIPIPPGLRSSESTKKAILRPLKPLRKNSGSWNRRKNPLFFHQEPGDLRPQ